jgi:hypothetical protein
MTFNLLATVQQMREAGTALKEAGLEAVKIGEEQLMLADRLEQSVGIRALAAPEKEKISPSANNGAIPSDRPSISTKDACHRILTQEPDHTMHKADLFEAIRHLGVRCKTVASMITAMSSDKAKRFKGIGDGRWTLAQPELSSDRFSNIAAMTAAQPRSQ